jgi:predicted RNase H-like nuclease (RuvC/YqgF family)
MAATMSEWTDAQTQALISDQRTELNATLERISELALDWRSRALEAEAALADRDATIARLRDELVKEELLHDEQLRRALTAKDAEIARLTHAMREAASAVDRCALYGPADAARERLDQALALCSQASPLPAPPAAKEADRG